MARRNTQDKELVAIGSNIKSKRLSLGLTQEDVAEMVGINTRTFQDIESGKVDIKTATIKKLVAVLKFKNSADLLGF